MKYSRNGQMGWPDSWLLLQLFAGNHYTFGNFHYSIITMKFNRNML